VQLHGVADDSIGDSQRRSGQPLGDHDEYVHLGGDQRGGLVDDQ
jgi:hypothetical protein